jgi:hypothetical protein
MGNADAAAAAVERKSRREMGGVCMSAPFRNESSGEKSSTAHTTQSESIEQLCAEWNQKPLSLYKWRAVKRILW